jgi:hypothetical protein
VGGGLAPGGAAGHTRPIGRTRPFRFRLASHLSWISASCHGFSTRKSSHSVQILSIIRDKTSPSMTSGPDAPGRARACPQLVG